MAPQLGFAEALGLCRPGRLLFALLAAVALQAPGTAAIRPLPECIPGWAKRPNSETPDPRARCPHGKRLPGDVTFNQSFHDHAPLQHSLYVLWSYTPMAVITLAVLEFLLKRGTRELQFVLFIATVTGFNELFLKALAVQRRPEGSCNFSCGMPSGHSTMSIGFLVLMFLDSAFRICPMDPEYLDESLQGKRWCGSRSIKSCLSVMPLANQSAISNLQFVVLFSVWFIILAPVPLSRVMLSDHSVPQAFIGSCIGAGEAIIWYCLISQLATRYKGYLRMVFPAGAAPGRHLLVHNYAVPDYQSLMDYIMSLPKTQAVEMVANLKKDISRVDGLSDFESGVPRRSSRSVTLAPPEVQERS